MDIIIKTIKELNLKYYDKVYHCLFPYTYPLKTSNPPKSLFLVLKTTHIINGKQLNNIVQINVDYFNTDIQKFILEKEFKVKFFADYMKRYNYIAYKAFIKENITFRFSNKIFYEFHLN